MARFVGLKMKLSSTMSILWQHESMEVRYYTVRPASEEVLLVVTIVSSQIVKLGLLLRLHCADHITNDWLRHHYFSFKEVLEDVRLT